MATFSAQVFFEHSDFAVLVQVKNGAIRFGADPFLQAAINWLINPPDAEASDFWQSPVGQYRLNERRWVAGEFIRKFDDKSFPYYKLPPRGDKHSKDFVRLKAQLWGWIWLSIKVLPPIPMGVIKPHNGEIFYRLVEEDALTSVNFYRLQNESEKLTGTELIRLHQSYNRSLAGVNNPFDQVRYPETWSFVENCKTEAERNEAFHKKFYKEIVTARQNLTSFAVKSSVRLCTGAGQSEMRGRRSGRVKADKRF
ncbi:MAG: hypothetical protein Kow00121_36710 [Elainellaceae cyanobacterium]